jgi:salicylate hydroxylase
VPGRTDRPTLIVGAGIGGLTLALSLARRGRDVILIERRTALEEEGAGIQLSPNASRVLIGLGLAKPLARIAGEPDRLVVRRGRTGAILAAAPLGGTMRRRFGAPYCVAHRADLQMILLDAVRALPQVRILFGRSIEAIRSVDDAVEADIMGATGIETLTGQALIGADGLHSRVAVLLGDASEPAFHGHVAWRGTFDAARMPEGIAAGDTGLWLGPGAHLVHYPLRGGSRINVVAVVGNKSAETPGSPGEGEAAGPAERFEAWARPARALLDAVEAWRAWPLYDRASRKSWTVGRATLLGDAAHPVLPFLAQGGALAIEDAVVLAAELTSADDAVTAMKRYEASRRPRVERVQRTARRNGRTYHLGFPLDLARDIVIGRTGERLTDRYDWIYGWTPER